MKLANEKSSASGGIGVLGLLGVAFVVLKLCNVIDWSWWYVTLPFWGPLALAIGLCLVLGLFFGITAVIGLIIDKIK